MGATDAGTFAPEQLIPWLDDAVHLATARLRNRTFAEDAVQEACLDALRAGGRFRGDGDRARAWFLTLVINRCRMIGRGLQRRAHHTAVAGSSHPQTGRDADHDLGEALRTTLATLPEHEREVIELRFLAGLDFAEIAASLGRRDKTVRCQADRGLARMREAMARVGLASGGPPALGLLLAGLPREGASAELVGAVGRMPATPPPVPAALAGAKLAVAAVAAIALVGTLLARWAPWRMPMPPPRPVQAVAAEPPPALTAPAVRGIGGGRFSAPGRIAGLAFSPDGRRLAWWTDYPNPSAGWWSPGGGDERQIDLPAGLDLRSGAWLDDGRFGLLALKLPEKREPSDGEALALAEVLVAGSDGVIRQRIPLPACHRPDHLARSPNGRWLACATGAPDGELRLLGAGETAEPVDGGADAGYDTGVAVIDTATGTVVERVGPFTVAACDAVKRIAVDDAIIAVILTGNLVEDGGGKNLTSHTLIIWDRATRHRRATIDLPWNGLDTFDLRWRGGNLLVLSNTFGSPVNALVDPDMGAVVSGSGWPLLFDGREMARLGRGGLIPIGNVHGVSGATAGAQQVAIATGWWSASVFDATSGRSLDAGGLPAPPDDLGWAGGALVMRLGEGLVSEHGTGLAVWIPPGDPQSVPGRHPFSAGGDRVMMGGEGVTLFDAGSGKPLGSIDRQGFSVARLDVSPDGSHMLVGWKGMHGGLVTLHRCSDGRLIAELPARIPDWLPSRAQAAWSADFNRVFIDCDGEAPPDAGGQSPHALTGCWSTSDGRWLWYPADSDGKPLLGVQEMQPVGSGAVLARRSMDGKAEVVLLDAATGRALRRVADPGPGMRISAHALRAIGSTAIVSLADGAVQRTLPAALAVVPSPDGGWIASCDHDGLRIEDTAGAGCLLSFPLKLPPSPAGEHPRMRIAWDVAGDHLAVSSSHGLPVWVVDPFAADGLGDPVQARHALDGERWPAAIGCLAAAGEAGWAAVADRVVDARQVLLYERFAMAGLPAARTALAAAGAGAGPLAVLARDALARLALRARGPIPASAP